MITQLPTRHFGLTTNGQHWREEWKKSLDVITEDVLFNDMPTRNNTRRLQSGGVNYARKEFEAETEMAGKTAARDYILRSLDLENWPFQLKILTMPGLRWKFERALFKLRKSKRNTLVYAVERDPAIWFGSLKYMPISEQHGIKLVSPHCISGHRIAAYYFTTAESFITDPQCPVFDAAWLDFTGQISKQRLEAVKRFWQTRVRWQMTVTGLYMNYGPRTWASFRCHGGIFEWLKTKLGGDTLISDSRFYQDGGHSPMFQVTFQKRFDVPAEEWVGD